MVLLKAVQFLFSEFLIQVLFENFLYFPLNHRQWQHPPSWFTRLLVRSRLSQLQSPSSLNHPRTLSVSCPRLSTSHVTDFQCTNSCNASMRCSRAKNQNCCHFLRNMCSVFTWQSWAIFLWVTAYLAWNIPALLSQTRND